MPITERTSSLRQGTSGNVFNLIIKSSSYRRFAAAFQEATGLTLLLISAPPNAGCVWNGGKRKINLCGLLSRYPEGQTACKEFARQRLGMCWFEKAACTSTCASGLVTTVLPIFNAGAHVATLVAGRVFRDRRRPADWKRITKLVGKCGLRELERMRTAYCAVPVVPTRRIRAASCLLAFFGKTLEEHIPAWVLAKSPTAPANVLKAEDYIQQHLGETIHLAEIARHAGLGVQHFCKVFRRNTGLTFTQFLNRSRVEQAKALLQDKSRRIAEIAFACGFGSVNAFNRNFKSIAGIAPGKYRLSLAHDR